MECPSFENQAKGIVPSYCIYPMMYTVNCTECLEVEFIYLCLHLDQILYLKQAQLINLYSSGRKIVHCLHYFLNLCIIGSSCLHDVLLVLCGLTDNLSITGLYGLDENSFLGVNL